MSSAPAFSAPPRRAAAASSVAPSSFSSFGRPSHEDFGGGSGRNGFDEAASAAFGKKPARTFETPQDSAPKVVVKPARNTLASVLDDLLPPEPESKQREWSTSALQKQRKAEKAKPPPPKSFDEEFPALGGGACSGGGPRVPKPVFATETSTSTGSFASLAANWAKSEEERKAAEASALRARLEQQRRDELERAERVHFRTNLNVHTRYHDDYEYGNETGYGDGYNDDEYVEGELDEYETYSKKDIRADKRAAANHYSDEEEDEETADYNIGTVGAW